MGVGVRQLLPQVRHLFDMSIEVGLQECAALFGICQFGDVPLQVFTQVGIAAVELLAFVVAPLQTALQLRTLLPCRTQDSGAGGPSAVGLADFAGNPVQRGTID